MNQAKLRRLLDQLSLHDLLIRYPRRPGNAAIRALLAAREAHRMITRSELEVQSSSSSTSAVCRARRQPVDRRLRGRLRLARAAHRRGARRPRVPRRPAGFRQRSRPGSEAVGRELAPDPHHLAHAAPLRDDLDRDLRRMLGVQRRSPHEAHRSRTLGGDHAGQPGRAGAPGRDRQLVRPPPGQRFGAGLVVSEMVSSFGLAYGNERTVREFLRIHPDEHPVSIQLFGHDPAIMREAAAMAAASGADLIDLNMGCPVRRCARRERGPRCWTIPPRRSPSLPRRARAAACRRP